MNLSIVIPVFNEEENILPLCRQIVSVMSGCPEISRYEVLIVNDGSTDASADRLASLKDPHLKVITLKKRQGQSAAFASGIHAAAFNVIATLDADLQNDPNDLPKMLLMLNQGADFVQGWRTPRRDPLSKKIASKIANAARRWVLKDSFHDISCSERVFKKESVKTVEFFPGAHRFLPYLAEQAGYKVVEYKVGHHPRVAGVSKYGLHNRILGPAKDLLRLYVAQQCRSRGEAPAMCAHKFKLRVAAYLAIFGFLSAGLLMMNQYGYGDDEVSAVFRGQRAYQIITNVFSGHAGKAKALIEGAEVWNFHPSLYALINYQFCSSFLRHLGCNQIVSFHVLNLVAASLVLFAVFKLALEIFDEEVALFSILFLMFFPRFVGHAQFNPKNIPVMAASTISILFLYRWTRLLSRRAAVYSGLWMGLAAAIDLQSLELLPLFPLTVLLFTRNSVLDSAPSRSPKDRRIHCLYYFGAVCLSLYLLWPHLWMDPGFLFRAVRHFSGRFEQATFLYFGTVYHRTSVPWHYYPFFLLVSTPLVTWVFTGVGAWRLSYGDRSGRNRDVLFMLLLWAALPVLIRTNAWTVKYNQFRHLFLALPPLMILAGYGGKAFLDLIREKVSAGRRPQIYGSIGIGLLLYFSMQLIPVHPYEGEYFNEAFRLFYPNHIEERFEFPVWGMTSYEEAIAWLNRSVGRHVSVRGIPSSYIDPYRNRKDLNFDGREGKYALVYSCDLERRSEFNGQTPLFEVVRYNSRLIAVFLDTPNKMARTAQ